MNDMNMKSTSHLMIKLLQKRKKIKKKKNLSFAGNMESCNSWPRGDHVLFRVTDHVIKT